MSKKLLRFFNHAFKLSKDLGTYFYKGWKAKLLSVYCVHLLKTCVFQFDLFRTHLWRSVLLHHVNDLGILKLKSSSDGLHSLLPTRNLFSYSIVFLIKGSPSDFTRISIKSFLAQSAPHIEILIGFKNVLKECEKIQDPRVKWRAFDATATTIEMTNTLAEEATGNYLVICEEDIWLRPDFLFRYEQTASFTKESQSVILTCDHSFVNDQGYFLPYKKVNRVGELHLPFLFDSLETKVFVISKEKWQQCKGFQREFQGAEIEHLFFDAFERAACFIHIPVPLYAVKVAQKDTSSKAILSRVLKNYSVQTDRNWSVCCEDDRLRIIPPLPSSSSILVIIPYRDQKELTLKAVKSVLAQHAVCYKICAVDNGSQDMSIGQEIISLGGEVLVSNEPFNYSRLNNFAVSMSKYASECDTLLFLNNDVELQKGALEEMLRWVHQKEIGLVGCCLYYPDGRLQHGGVKLNPYGIDEMHWEHIEKMVEKKQMRESSKLAICQAVTAACAMVRKDVFQKVGGFDEIYYPVSYSDTHLSTKITALGLKNFYTPYAVGIHYESISRGKVIEDFEKSLWLNQLLENKKID